MNLDLTDDETAALLRELDNIIENDRFFLSPRIQTLKVIRAKLKPYPVREPLPPVKAYEPPRASAARGDARAVSAASTTVHRLARRGRGQPERAKSPLIRWSAWRISPLTASSAPLR
jgi:hypothetical protein